MEQHIDQEKILLEGLVALTIDLSVEVQVTYRPHIPISTLSKTPIAREPKVFVTADGNQIGEYPMAILDSESEVVVARTALVCALTDFYGSNGRPLITTTQIKSGVDLLISSG